MVTDSANTPASGLKSYRQRLLRRWQQRAGSHDIVIGLFLRLLGLIYLAAFASFGAQVTGLIGSDGILPLVNDLAAIRAEYGDEAWLLYPSVFWFDASDTMLLAVCLAGIAVSLLLVANIRTRLVLPVLFVLYLSLVYAGQVFMSFQWDFMLLEAGFLAIFLPWGSPLIIWLMHWLLFRVRFMSGVAKLMSGDESWAGFTALNYYFETQPLPHAGAWFAHQLPEWLLRAGTGWTFFVELLVPFMLLLPRRPRFVAAWLTIAMQLMIMATSNHNFFNLLTIALCLLLFDDKAIRSVIKGRWLLRAGDAVVFPGRIANGFGMLLATAIVSTSVTMMWAVWTKRDLPDSMELPVRWTVQWHVVNNYHIFPIITTERPELAIEGSNDGVFWQAYGFKYKPGYPTQLPPFVIPHQPRLDWQMWFAALTPPYTRTSYWIHDFRKRLLQGSPDVLALLAHNPFPDGPPRFIRARIENYRFATLEERKATGNWWVIEPLGMYLPPLSLEMLQEMK
ncbi:MAG: lipase maturation factor family protein [Pseudomonadota bacterium]